MLTLCHSWTTKGFDGFQQYAHEINPQGKDAKGPTGGLTGAIDRFQATGSTNKLPGKKVRRERA